jgi:hypothetical protein
MFDLALELVIPALRRVIGLVGYVVADFLVGIAGQLGLKRLGTRAVRAEASAWIAAEDWEAYLDRYRAASLDEQQVLIELGQARPELAEMYADALQREWYLVLHATEVLRKTGTPLTPELQAAVRQSADAGGLRAQAAGRLHPA